MDYCICIYAVFRIFSLERIGHNRRGSNRACSRSDYVYVDISMALRFVFQIPASSCFAFAPTFITYLIWIGAHVTMSFPSWFITIPFAHAYAAFVAVEIFFTIAYILNAVIGGFSPGGWLRPFRGPWKGVRFAGWLTTWSSVFTSSRIFRFETRNQFFICAGTLFWWRITLLVALILPNALFASIHVQRRFALAFVIIAFCVACRRIGFLLNDAQVLGLQSFGQFCGS